MPTYKLTYFDGRGRAEVLRVIFVLAEQPFEDVRITSMDWPTMKPTTPFGQLPVLEIDGKIYGQSMALARHLARVFGFYGKTTLQALEVDQVVCLLQELIEEAVKLAYVEESKKAEVTNEFRETVLPKYLGYLTKLLTANGGKHFVGDAMTLADLLMWDCMFSLKKGVDGFDWDKYSELQDFFTSVSSVEKIASYMASRKETPF